MAVRRIRQLGDPMLRVRCERVQNPKSAATRLVADDLRDSLAVARKKYKMGRALAAPQIGAPVRIVFVQTDKQRWTMINPEITDVGRDDLMASWRWIVRAGSTRSRSARSGRRCTSPASATAQPNPGRCDRAAATLD